VDALLATLSRALMVSRICLVLSAEGRRFEAAAAAEADACWVDVADALDFKVDLGVPSPAPLLLLALGEKDDIVACLSFS
jgi:hypothetical protein